MSKFKEHSPPYDQRTQAKALRRMSPELWEVASLMLRYLGKHKCQKSVFLVTSFMRAVYYGHSMGADNIYIIPDWPQAYCEYAELKRYTEPLGEGDAKRARMLYLVKKLAELMFTL